MGEEESSAKDDDNIPAIESIPVPSDDGTKPTMSSSLSSTSSTTRTTNKLSGLSQQPLQSHSTPGSYASNLYTLNNVPLNTGTIHFTPNNDNNNNSKPSLGTGPFSSTNVLPNYHGAYSVPYSHTSSPSGVPRYQLPTTTTTTTLYMTSTAPFIGAPSSSSASSSYYYPLQQHPNMTTNNWYHHHQYSQTSSEAQQFGPPQ
jgi:hypothetical protein